MSPPGSSWISGAAVRAVTGLQALPIPAALRRLLARQVRRLLGQLAGAGARTPGAQRLRTHAGGRAIGYREDRGGAAPSGTGRVVAFYLPQFHPIPENDRFWGRGFTEWRNVARALPQFEGHVQPRLPGELGFYDLRVPEVLTRQVELARQYGVGAFCFYVYWFGGRRLLDAPIRQYLADARLDLPFCLCWANEPWTRRWDGREDEVLVHQEHSADDDLAFIDWLHPFLADPRYLRVEGKPLVIVYRLELLPDPAATARRWRERCRAAGLGEIHLACVESFQRTDPRDAGFDSAIEFPPNLSRTVGLEAQRALLNPDNRGERLDWRLMAEQFRTRTLPRYPLFRGVNPGWDNEARRPSSARAFVGASARGYEDWLRDALSSTAARGPSGDRNPVFVNAWNEWAEGAHLEPDARLGYAWLEATRRAQAAPASTQSAPSAVVHVHYPELAAEIFGALRQSGVDWRVIASTRPALRAQVELAAREAGLDVEIRVFENRGRDVLPFLKIVDELLDEGAGPILKLHTKRSPHLPNGDQWRRELLHELTAPARVATALKAFVDDPAIGMIGPRGHALSVSAHIGANAPAVEFLLRQMGAHGLRADDAFFAGSMHWTRPAGLRPLLDAHLDEAWFEDECGQLDGTFAHAIERVLALAVAAAGFRVAETGSQVREVGAPSRAPYPFVPVG